MKIILHFKCDCTWYPVDEAYSLFPQKECPNCDGTGEYDREIEKVQSFEVKP